MVDSEISLKGSIVDSWFEPPGAPEAAERLVLQVAPRGRPRDLLIVEAEASLVPDRDWLEDLGENLCHGSPVMAIGRVTLGGLIRATRIQLAR